MGVFGVICEYNPLHLGHCWQLKKARELGADTVVCAMSGDFVQRGAPALCHWRHRARAALQNGADLVLRIPTTRCLSSAQFFAEGGVAVLAAIGVDKLFFGSECGDLAALQQTAQLVESSLFQALFLQLRRQGLSYPRARQQAAAQLGDHSTVLQSPNDTLALEYLRALEGTGIRPLCLPRNTAGHHSTNTDSPIASATALRALLQADPHSPRARQLVPPGTLPGPDEMTDSRYLDRALCQKVQMASQQLLTALPFVDTGLANRLQAAAAGQSTLAGLVAAGTSPQHTAARIRRAVWCLYLGVTQQDVLAPVRYLHVLGANSRGLALLKGARLPVLTNLAGAKGTRYEQIERTAFAAFAGCLPHIPKENWEYTQKFLRV